MSFPRIEIGSIVAVDIEAYNKSLKKDGPQFLRQGPDYVVGVGLAWQTPGKMGNDSIYFAIAHTHGNYEGDVFGYLSELFGRRDLTFVFANAKYDLSGIYSYGIEFGGRLVDIQVTEALLDEDALSYSLDNIAKRRGLPGKDTTGLLEALPKLKNGEPDWTRIREVHPFVVGNYCMQDCITTLDVFNLQFLDIVQQDLLQVYNLESDLIKILFEMNISGVRVDIGKAEREGIRLRQENSLEEQRLQRELGAFDMFSSASLAEIVKRMGYTPPKTAEDADSITSEWLRSTGEKSLVELAELKRSVKIERDFITGVVLNQNYHGRIHPTYFSTRGSGFLSGDDTNGTRSGRLACTDPNLQQIPKRHPTLGKLTRGLFLPEREEFFCASDYQAQEVRVGIHYAIALGLSGSEEYRKLYQENPMFDYHTRVRDLINASGIVDINRDRAKTAGLAIQYGIGKAKLAKGTGMSLSETATFLEVFHREVPWVKEALTRVSKVAEERGYVKTMLGRRRRFDQWENGVFGAKWEPPKRSREEAAAKWSRIKRFGVYKAFNAIVQGTSAEMMKLAIVQAHKEGFNILLTVHDELCVSVPSDKEARRLKELMENVIPLNVPVVADAWLGDDWSGTNKVKL